MFQGDAFDVLATSKSLLFLAAEDIKEARKVFPCTHVEGCIHFALLALRGISLGRNNWIRNAGKGSTSVHDTLFAGNPEYLSNGSSFL